MIQRTLSSEYICYRIGFQGISDESFETEEAFCKMFVNQVVKALKRFNSTSVEYINLWKDSSIKNINELSEHILKCARIKKSCYL